MAEKKYCIVLDDFERRVVINGLIQFRTQLLSEGQNTEALDEVLLKIIDAKQKRFRVIREDNHG